MYFDKFPKILYEFNINGVDTAIYLTDITRNIRFRRDVLSNISVYDYYDIQDGDTPDKIAELVYGNAKYHWIVMLMNDCYDYRNDFPMTTHTLEKYIQSKYGDDLYAIHHYINDNGYIVNSDYSGATSVSNYDYEMNVNETKRRIKIVPKELIDKVLSDYDKLI